jgi:TolB-like protein
MRLVKASNRGLQGVVTTFALRWKERVFSEPMAAVPRNEQLHRDEVERVLSSACFARSERASKLFRYLVERQLEGRESELKESVIGVEVFGRRPDYDPKVDSTVRTEAVRLRARLSEYYSTEGSQDAIVIDLPKGGYVPNFRQRTPVPIVQTAVPRRLWLTVALVGFTASATAIGAWWILPKNASIPIAVLPLVNLSQDPANDYFADGLTDEIIRNLSIIEGLAVRSQTSSFAFKGKAQNVREAAKQLGADYILEGSVLRAGQQLRINAQLVRGSDDVPIWSARYDREFADIFAIQDEISRGIVNSLRLKLGRGRRRYETSVEAYDLYLRARALGGGGRFALPGFRQSIPVFEQAIAKDPTFAPAYAGLAVAHVVLSGNFTNDIPGELAKIRPAAEKAVQLDPLSAESHDALGTAYAREAQWEQSEKSFLRAIEIQPGRAESHAHLAAYLLLPLGRIDEAIRHLRIAEKNDPLSSYVHYWLGDALADAGRNEEAAAVCEKMASENPNRQACVFGARTREGRVGEVIRIYEGPRQTHPDEDGRPAECLEWGRAWVCLCAGRPPRRSEESSGGDQRHFAGRNPCVSGR